mgnify:CR=1 FL=1
MLAAGIITLLLAVITIGFNWFKIYRYIRFRSRSPQLYIIAFMLIWAAWEMLIAVYPHTESLQRMWLLLLFDPASFALFGLPVTVFHWLSQPRLN